MPDLTMETYDVVLGIDPTDPAREIWATGLMTYEHAEKTRRNFDALRAEGAFAAAKFANGQTFFVWVTSGTQTRPSTATNRQQVRDEMLADPTGTAVLYVRQQNPLNFIRVASAPIAQILKMAP